MNINIKNIATNAFINWMERQDTIDEAKAERYVDSLFAGLKKINLEAENLQSKSCETQESA